MIHITGQEIVGFFSGASALVVLGHAVNTFPVPQNPYGKWLLGTIQFAIGQRLQASQTKSTGENQ